MKTAVIIPARYGSEEIECKVLARIGGKPMIQHVYERCEAAQPEIVAVATDDERIAEVVEGFGGTALLTSRQHICGTDRVAEAVEKLPYKPELVVNVQADEPFIDPSSISEVVRALNCGEDMVTLVCPITREEEMLDPFVVKVVVDQSSHALYFSRSPIPSISRARRATPLRHIGIYGYTYDFLKKFASLGPSRLELTESLEQLRALESGFPILVVLTSSFYPHISVNTPQDLAAAQALLSEEGKN